MQGRKCILWNCSKWITLLNYVSEETQFNRTSTEPSEAHRKKHWQKQLIHGQRHYCGSPYTVWILLTGGDLDSGSPPTPSLTFESIIHFIVRSATAVFIQECIQEKNWIKHFSNTQNNAIRFLTFFYFPTESLSKRHTKDLFSKRTKNVIHVNFMSSINMTKVTQ